MSKKSFSLFFAALEICCTKRSLRTIRVFYIFVSIFWTSNIFLYSQRVSLYSSETNLIKENHECEKVLWKDKSFALPYFLYKNLLRDSGVLLKGENVPQDCRVAWIKLNVNVEFLLCSLQRSTFAQQLAPIQEVKTKLTVY